MLKRLFASRKRPYLINGHIREKIRIDLSGNILTMELPPHHSYGGFAGDTSSGEKAPPESINIYSPDGYWSDQIEEEEGMGWRREGFAMQSILKREWDFMGPVWRGRPLGSISMVMMLCHDETLPETMSYFNPSDFGKITLRAAYFKALRAINLHKPKVPVNWQVIQKQQIPWVLYEIHDTLQGDPEQTRLLANSLASLMIPLAREYSLRLYFTYTGYTPVSFSRKNMNKVRDQIIESMQLSYTPEHLQQIRHLRERHPESTITEELEPMPWVFPEWRIGDADAGEPEYMITKAGTPAPTLS
ncbi:hypothetical protein [Endozoicomonas numazuensis]|uniref:Uncharacterized protein n=1 Tax=Endozoicomonas numazuensis TaxID=1137799 RepID=A0A081NE71_9GAMM|nr:hypothetical protein [Endozoicomonas numazuensis]KEQ16744.1 hypothetical protein GZ78_18815 [Endozoicomonas numazuensis]